MRALISTSASLAAASWPKLTRRTLNIEPPSGFHGSTPLN
jgi:hypothetical protein